MKQSGRSFRKAMAFCLAVILLVGCAGGIGVYADTDTDTSGHKLTSRYPLYQTIAGSEETIPYYKYYLEEGETKGWKDAPKDAAVAVDLGSGRIVAYYDKNKQPAEGGDPIALEDGAYAWKTDEAIRTEWTIVVSQSGYYNMEFTYTSMGGSVDPPRRSFFLDGETLYAESANLIFPRLWEEGGEPWINAVGDQVRPKQVEVIQSQTMRMMDARGRYIEPLKVYLEAGEHVVALETVQENLKLEKWQFVAPKTVKTYAEVLAEYESKGYAKADASIKINAEDAAYKTALGLRRETSTDPVADPPSLETVKLNIIGGTGWSEGNQTIIWNFHVATPGLYKLNLRVNQQYNDGLSSYRSIAIDGQVPYREWLCYEFPEEKWRTTTVADEQGNPYLVYLDAGDHTLEMAVKTAPYSDILFELETTLETLSTICQNIIMITGIEPDTGFDYRLDTKIPWLMDAFREVRDGLGAQIRLLNEMSNKKSNAVNSLEEILYRIRKLISDPYSIPRYLNTLIEYQTTLASYINNFNNLALALDFMTFDHPDAEVENKQANFFQHVWAAIKQFLLSFTKDYNSIYGMDNENQQYQASLEVWVSQGREWAETLKQISDEDFVKNQGVYVSYNLLPTGSLGQGGVLLMAIASGNEPDVVLGTDSATPAEYGMRNAILDLSKMEGYDDFVKRFLPGAMTPYLFQGKTFALPETMDFSLMFYRTDILEMMGLQVPDTWNELFTTIVPELKRNGMDFWYEGSLYTLLFQHGGNLYTEDGKASALDSQEAQAAFKQFADMYLVYDVPVAANFYNRFRAGSMPIGISSFMTYMQLMTAAPEIDGKWAVAPLPATVRADGQLDRSNLITTTSSMILNTTEYPEEAWEYLKWYMSADTQIRYANDLEAYIGSTVRWFSANIEAFDALSWDLNLKSTVSIQREWTKGIPNVIGGYITARHIENARVRSVVESMNYRESLEKAAEDITREMQLKQEEFQRREAANK